MYVAAFVDETKCIGCKMCMQTCPEPNAIKFVVERKKSNIDTERCKGCGVCVMICPKKAIELRQITFAEENKCTVTTCME